MSIDDRTSIMRSFEIPDFAEIYRVSLLMIYGRGQFRDLLSEESARTHCGLIIKTLRVRYPLSQSAELVYITRFVFAMHLAMKHWHPSVGQTCSNSSEVRGTRQDMHSILPFYQYQGQLVFLGSSTNLSRLLNTNLLDQKRVKQNAVPNNHFRDSTKQYLSAVVCFGTYLTKHTSGGSCAHSFPPPTWLLPSCHPIQIERHAHFIKQSSCIV